VEGIFTKASVLGTKALEAPETLEVMSVERAVSPAVPLNAASTSVAGGQVGIGCALAAEDKAKDVITHPPSHAQISKI
jgi:hypothetical protein